MENLLIDNAIDYVKEIFENDYSGHDFFHTFRVYKMATAIAVKECAKLEIVQLAALLHDVDDIKLSPETYENKDRAVNFLKLHGVDDETINHFYEKLFLLKELMNTKTAKEIAEHREQYMRQYISEFMDEWDGLK